MVLLIHSLVLAFFERQRIRNGSLLDRFMRNTFALVCLEGYRLYSIKEINQLYCNITFCKLSFLLVSTDLLSMDRRASIDESRKGGLYLPSVSSVVIETEGRYNPQKRISLKLQKESREKAIYLRSQGVHQLD